MTTPTTPLLPSANQSASYNTIPVVSSTNGALAGHIPERSLDIPNPESATLSSLCEHFAISPHRSASETALILVALLRTLKRSRELEEGVKGKSTRNTWEAKERVRGISARLEGLVEEVWEMWLKEGDGEAERVLWDSVAPGRYGRVVDFLPLLSVPASFGSHELIQLSFHTTWGTGLHPFFLIAESLSSVSRLLAWMDSFSTPRLLHLHALVLRIGHLLLAIWLALYPSLMPQWGIPEILWTVFTICTSLELPFHPSLFRLLSLLSLLTGLPYPPRPSTLSFLLLLSSIAVSLIAFHLPLHPSPIHLFVNKTVIATSTRFEYLLSRALIPSVLYFLPIVLTSIVGLALALNGDPWHPYLLLRDAFTSPVSPYETRIACLVAVILAIAGYIWLIEFATVELAARGEQRENEEAQRGFVTAMIDYTYLPGRKRRTGYRMPAPLNVLELLAADIPFWALFAFPHRREQAQEWRITAKAVVWRICVGPVVAALSLLYAWEWVLPRIWRRSRAI
ncbi:hypothetical protein DACRYDRAFT_114283 [Dacryopinax primogenitus]|uniref:Uncharacterized protein n=1 Tax=Dacryopinax primogenitus (strain DJM 731) TaxID=1858805 RepID=M5G9N0_DACPD|nr:uncharacterized protein DACRYDRAFT_114283 [Dacryopinax primogenitus]EJU04980.1 hypothetical protein DACRYDRAFT_114283 [Dacryopinax primogenitus]